MNDRSTSSPGSGVFSLSRLAGEGTARRGTISTARGEVPTPTIVPVGPLATAGSLTAEDLRAAGCSALGVDWLRLYFRPGIRLIAEQGGLHRYIGWSGPLIAGPISQEYRAAPTRRELAAGVVVFVSPIDGSRHEMTPESSVNAQSDLGLDLAEGLGPAGAGGDSQRLDWAERALAARPRDLPLIARIDVDWPAESIGAIAALPFDGFVLGGLQRRSAADVPTALGRALAALPERALRVADWDGGWEAIPDLVACGVDLIRVGSFAERARERRVMVGSRELEVPESWREDPSPLDPDCGCPTCRLFSRAYLHHLVASDELLGLRLLERHNVEWMLRASGFTSGPTSG